jgi:hypothetical protein
MGDPRWYLRFLLPAFPSLILLATGGLSMIWDYFASPSAGRWPRALKGAALVAITLLFVGWMGTATVRLPLFDQRSGEKIYPDAALWQCTIFSGSFTSAISRICPRG